MERLQAFQNRVFRLTGVYFLYIRIEQMHPDLEMPMPMPKTYGKASKLYASAKLNKNRLIKKLGADF